VVFTQQNIKHSQCFISYPQTSNFTYLNNHLEETMKKLALILALLIIPCTAFGLEMLSDSSLDEVTGQAGVNIAVDDIQLFLNIEKMAWIDCDGFDSLESKGTCSGRGGAMVLNNFQIDVLNINAITRTAVQGSGNGLGLGSTSCGDIDLFYDYATSATLAGCLLNGSAGQDLGLNNYHGKLGDNSTFVPHFLTIDVTDALPASSEGFRYWRDHGWTSAAVFGHNAMGADSIGGVLIGIPTVEIYINEMVFTPVYDGDIGGQTSTAANDDGATWIGSNGAVTSATFGTIQMTGITFTPLGGWIEISPK
jgi:uncharacterized protein DUF6160